MYQAGLLVQLVVPASRLSKLLRQDSRFFTLCHTGADKENEEDKLDNLPKLPWEGSDRDYSYQELLGGLCWNVIGCITFKCVLMLLILISPKAGQRVR